MEKAHRILHRIKALVDLRLLDESASSASSMEVDEQEDEGEEERRERERKRRKHELVAASVEFLNTLPQVIARPGEKGLGCDIYQAARQAVMKLSEDEEDDEKGEEEGKGKDEDEGTMDKVDLTSMSIGERKRIVLPHTRSTSGGYNR